MTWTYSINDDIGKIRLYTGDVAEGKGVRVDGTNFSDEELTLLLEQEEDDWRRVVAAVCEILSIEWARVADVTVGPRKETLSGVSKRYGAMAATFRQQFGGGSGEGSAFAVGLVRTDGYSEASS
jgi:hypothetical protein